MAVSAVQVRKDTKLREEKSQWRGRLRGGHNLPSASDAEVRVRPPGTPIAGLAPHSQRRVPGLGTKDVTALADVQSRSLGDPGSVHAGEDEGPLGEPLACGARRTRGATGVAGGTRAGPDVVRLVHWPARIGIRGIAGSRVRGVRSARVARRFRVPRRLGTASAGTVRAVHIRGRIPIREAPGSHPARCRCRPINASCSSERTALPFAPLATFAVVAMTRAKSVTAAGHQKSGGSSVERSIRASRCIGRGYMAHRVKNFPRC